jgi:DNA-binding NarL/FixJ family response regulator
MLRLIYAGMDRLVCLEEEWERELRRAVRSILRGEFCVPRSVLERYARQTARFLAPAGRAANSLTPREIQLVNLVVRRFSNREISGMLSISERSVKFHVSNVFHKAGIQSRDQLFANIAIEFPRSDTSLPFPAAITRQDSARV